MLSFIRHLIPGRWLGGQSAPSAPATSRPPALPDIAPFSTAPVPLEPPVPITWPGLLLRDDPAAPLWRSGRWSPEVLASLRARQFLALCRALFAPTGAKVLALPREPEGMLDLRLYSQREHTPVTMVRCMHHPGSPVDVPELREFLVAIAAQRLQHGTFATSSSFTPEALDFASDSGFSALDGGSLLAMIGRRTPQQQRALLATVCAADD